MASSTATIYMLSTLAMGTFTLFAVLIVLYIGALIISWPMKFFWRDTIKGLIKRK
jgi:hypothetical protein